VLGNLDIVVDVLGPSILPVWYQVSRWLH